MSSLPLVFFVLQFFKIFFSSFLSPQCGNYKSKAFFFNVKCIYLKKYKINYKPVFAYGLSLSFYQSGVCPFPCSASRAGEKTPSERQSARW